MSRLKETERFEKFPLEIYKYYLSPQAQQSRQLTLYARLFVYRYLLDEEMLDMDSEFSKSSTSE